ncbi:mannitol dehydrogenase family protein [Swaminathania salitolerans]|uniref:Mannitol dehydrogenase n=1 Tax=Swaminathania salitolerans TaxID=182838 RepID=A0A511BLZ8_9PROT|nr:mannitol dehydrogenase family protein [Swaminathania salitolerans]GBQ10404.1 D-mannonate oxidoreductase [Swaminathania salitolerans LMG 21291]GEL01275.1 mannitol dehydrogenase [Swaminathania salitolerans]
MLLSRATLELVPETVHTPRFLPEKLRSGLLHLGCGNFHRAHQVTATQAAIGQQGVAGLDWGITSVTMRRPDLAQSLSAQDNLYTLLTREPTGTVASVMGAITRALHAGDPSADIAAELAAEGTHIVTLTVTASGYHLRADGSLDPDATEIVADLGQSRPRTAIGILAAGLARVRTQGGTPPVILCCDNLPHNGETLRGAVLDFLALRGDDALAGWVADTVRFPNTMVDRIVPIPSADDREDARRFLGGLEDRIPLSAEPWFQWIIEDFEGKRPFWEAHPGTKFVSDVDVFERAKLQMLNGTHMILAYVGALAGLGTIAEAAADPALGTIAARFMRQEQTAGVALPGNETDAYARDLMARFRNPGIVHEVERIGRNGSAKMASRIIQPMRENLMAGRAVTGATLLIASWIRWFALHEQEALEIALVDPRADTLRQLCAEARDDHAAQAEAFLAMESVFGPPLPDHDRQVENIATMLRRLTEEDVGSLLRSLAH